MKSKVCKRSFQVWLPGGPPSIDSFTTSRPNNPAMCSCRSHREWKILICWPLTTSGSDIAGIIWFRIQGRQGTRWLPPGKEVGNPEISVAVSAGTHPNPNLQFQGDVTWSNMSGWKRGLGRILRFACSFSDVMCLFKVYIRDQPLPERKYFRFTGSWMHFLFRLTTSVFSQITYAQIYFLDYTRQL